MFKIKMGFKKKRKKAQHIVEFAILMPIFIAFFCFMFPVLTTTFRNFKFSYFASNLVTKALESPNPPFYRNKNDWDPERFSRQIEETLPDLGEEATIFLITKTPQVDFVSLGFRAPEKTIFGTIGRNYFYFMTPINSAYTEAPVFDIPTNTLNSTFSADNYYARPPAQTQRMGAPKVMPNKKDSDKGFGDEGMDGALGG